MKKRILCMALLLCLVVTGLTSCANAPYTIAQARNKADGMIEHWNRDDVRYCTNFYIAEYSAAEKTYSVHMHPLVSSETMLKYSVIQDTTAKIYRELHDACFANRPDVKLLVYVYTFRGECLYVFNGRKLTSV